MVNTRCYGLVWSVIVIVIIVIVTVIIFHDTQAQNVRTPLALVFEFNFFSLDTGGMRQCKSRPSLLLGSLMSV